MDSVGEIFTKCSVKPPFEPVWLLVRRLVIPEKAPETWAYLGAKGVAESELCFSPGGAHLQSLCISRSLMALGTAASSPEMLRLDHTGGEGGEALSALVPCLLQGNCNVSLNLC